MKIEIFNAEGEVIGVYNPPPRVLAEAVLVSIPERARKLFAINDDFVEMRLPKGAIVNLSFVDFRELVEVMYG